jgi:iron(III) transport system permease protein
LRTGTVAGAAFVFLSAMKELPITFILAPVGFETLAMNVWGYTNDALFADAAPFTLILLVLSSAFVALLFNRETKP